ncbi:MAG: putative quinol monooxygenase [Cyanobacteriota bacterium]|nr:putative quinol monooxygenase [Cyanobacteriota bacterium]
MEDPIRVVATITAQSGKENQVKSVLSNLVHPTHQEPGCLHYELLQNKDDSSQFVMVEEWETQNALDKHATAPHTKAAESKMETLIATSPPDVRFYRTIA